MWEMLVLVNSFVPVNTKTLLHGNSHWQSHKIHVSLFDTRRTRWYNTGVRLPAPDNNWKLFSFFKRDIEVDESKNNGKKQFLPRKPCAQLCDLCSGIFVKMNWFSGILATWWCHLAIRMVLLKRAHHNTLDLNRIPNQIYDRPDLIRPATIFSTLKLISAMWNESKYEIERLTQLFKAIKRRKLLFFTNRWPKPPNAAVCLWALYTSGVIVSYATCRFTFLSPCLRHNVQYFEILSHACREFGA